MTAHRTTGSTRDLGLLLLRVGVGSALFAHGPQRLFGQSGGCEVEATYALAATALALAGPGRLSLDHASGHVLSKPGLTRLAYVGAIAGAAYTIWSRRQTLEARGEAEGDET